MDRFIGARFTQDDMRDAIGAPLAAVAERHADELKALAPAFRDRLGDDGFAGKTSPWNSDEWESEQWAKHEDDEDYEGPTPEEVEAERRKVEDPWFAKTFGDDLSLGLKEAMARFVSPYDEAPAAFLADLQQTFSGLSGADAKAKMGAPFFDALAGMNSVTKADLERVREEGDETSNFARYARLVQSSPDEAARVAPKLTERLSAYLERARKEGASRPFDGGMDAEWEEDEHPRDDAGKFTVGAGSLGGGGKVKTQAEASAANPRTDGVPRGAGDVVASFTSDAEMKAHPAYGAAKAGDPDAAFDVVTDLVKPEMIEQARKRFGKGAVYAPVHAEESAGKNKLPTALAALYAGETGATMDTSVVQTNRAFHTGAKAMDRMIARPLFEGEVKKGARYVIVDDVTVMGATVAEMAHHIRAGGGEVAGVVTLVNAGRSGKMAAEPHRIREIERRFGDVVRQEFHIDPHALTADEAQFILNFRDADALRGRISSARDERGRRLSSKEGRGPEGGAGEGRQGGLIADSIWEEQDHPRSEDGKFSTSFGEPGAYASLKPTEVYSKLADAEDAGGMDKVKLVAQQIAKERPDLAESVVRQAADLGYSNIGVSIADTPRQSQRDREGPDAVSSRDNPASNLEVPKKFNWVGPDQVRAASEMLGSLRKSDKSVVGVRVIPPEYEGKVSIGEKVSPSYRWDNGEFTDERLDGVSAARVSSNDIGGVLLALNSLGVLGKSGPNGYYLGGKIVLVGGPSASSGEDDGEAVINNPEIIDVWENKGGESGRGTIIPKSAVRSGVREGQQDGLTGKGE